MPSEAQEKLARRRFGTKPEPDDEPIVPRLSQEAASAAMDQLLRRRPHQQKASDK